MSMSSSSSLIIISHSLNPPFTHTTPLSLSTKSSFPSLSTKSKSLTPRFSSSISSSNNLPDPDELRWLREEQRWLREEQRWLREEQRWNRERESLILEIAELKLKILALENKKKNQSTTYDVFAEDNAADTVKGLLQQQVIKEKNLIAATTSEKEEKVVDERIRRKDEEKVEKMDTVKRKTLRMGSEGEDVKALQLEMELLPIPMSRHPIPHLNTKFGEALGKLGFYSGEEDEEFSSFASGTQRAVKTWQATIGASEDGIMTSELLERLYTEQQISEIIINLDQEVSPTVSQLGGVNGAPVTFVTKISEVKETIVKKDGSRNDVSENRVFLLGENRWEDSSRLSGGKKKVVGNKTEIAKIQCTTCRGEGRIMCMECDGTGEPNIEEQVRACSVCFSRVRDYTESYNESFLFAVYGMGR
ncbi:hypothetical protein ACFE04_015091 [Oxalis oulophora]